jgi:hypothetical protein
MVSICIIGSVARHAEDILSDRDLLAIGEQEDIKDAVSQYVEKGWNIAQFSMYEFNSLAKSQSLFVQHVEQDGHVVRDDHGYLRSVLDGFQVKTSYYPELLAAINPILTIGELETSYWGKLFQADMLYVAIRNASILHSATDAAPEFDFGALVRWVSRAADLSPFDESLLLNLRRLKHGYRSRSTSENVSQVSQMIVTSKKLAKFWIDTCPSKTTSAKPSNGYYEMRNLERKLVCAVGPIYMDNLRRNHELMDLWSRICRSGPYEKKPKLECLPQWTEQVSIFMEKQHYN